MNVEYFHIFLELISLQRNINKMVYDGQGYSFDLWVKSWAYTQFVTAVQWYKGATL